MMNQAQLLHTAPARGPGGSAGPAPVSLRRTTLAALIAACFHAAHAGPVAPQVVHGQATFNQQGNLFTITNTPNTIINWQSFSVAAGEVARFVQQGADSSVLNRITGQDPSKILGALQSNGKVFLINPNGVLFGRDARVDVAGLVASSLALSNQDFLAGKLRFKAGEQAGAVINRGALTAGSGGQILLIAPSVENSGIITAPNGDVLLAAGHSVQLADAANPDLRVVLSAPGDQALNIGQVVAQGGRIGMAGALLNQRGVLNANSAVIGEGGKIVLKASGKALLEGGSVTSATAAAGKGGAVMVLGEQVGMQGDARVEASGATGGGTVLLGGDYQGRNPEVAHARQVAVGKDATIAADAIERGDGGTVVVWGDQTARVAGAISARGGAASGNGGVVETSGHYLAVDGIRVDTGAARGRRGTWLLDPEDIDVVAGTGGDLSNVDQFADAPASAVIGAGTIASAGSNVVLQATHRININSAIAMVNDGVGLSATAGEAINVNAPVTTRGGAVTLSANDASGGGAYGLTGNLILLAPISTNNGNAVLSAASIIGTGAINVGSGNLRLSSNLTGGGILLNGSGDQLLGSGASGQTVLLQADNMSFTGNLNFGGAGAGATLTFKPLTAGRQIDLGNKPFAVLGLTSAELNRVAANTVILGDSAAGDLTISAPVNLASQQSAGGIRNLSLATGGAVTAANKLSLRRDDSTLAVTAGGGLTVASGGGLAAGTSVSLAADQMRLGGAAQSIAAGSGTVSLNRRSSGGNIAIGSAAADSADTLGLSDSELKSVSAPAIAIGSADLTGTLTLQGALNLGTSAGLNLLALRTGGNINLNGDLAVPNDVTLAAGGYGSDRTVTASGGVTVGGAFVLDGGNWVQNSASLPLFSAGSFSINQGSFLRVKGGTGDAATPYQLADVYGLQGMGTQRYDKNMVLVADIDASGTANWQRGAGRTGFAPLFTGDDHAYAGVFDGGHHRISGLTIDGGVNPPYFGSGLFARISGATVRDLAMVGGSVVGGNNVGALVGTNSGGTLSNVSSSMAVSGASNVGGLVGFNSGTLGNASASGSVTGLASGVGTSAIGGLVGNNDSAGSISVARATGAIAAPGQQVGGLVGNNDGAIEQAYATGAVSGAASVGGLVGRNGGTVADAYASGVVGLASSLDSIARSNAGGVIGWTTAGSSATRLYFSGTVTGSGFAAGTVGAVVGRADAGAAVGPAYFDNSTAGTVADQGGATGRSAADMLKQDSYRGFSFGADPVWRIYDGHTTPLLKAFLTPLQVTASGATSKVYDGQVAGVGPLSYAGLLDGDLAADGVASYGAARNVGTYALGGLWSTRYDISYAGATSLSITPRALAVTVAGSKVYDGQLGFSQATFSLTNAVAGDSVGAAGTAQFADKNAGAGKPVTVSGLTLTGADRGNYSVAPTASGTADIARATLGLGTVSAAGKVYDGNTSASVSAGLDGVIGGDQVQLSGLAASFSDKNAGAAKRVRYSVAGSSLTGSDAGNYVLDAADGVTSAAITARVLTLVYTGVDKTYDGSTAATLIIADDRIAGDVLTATASAAFLDKNAGSGKTVIVSNAGVSGSDAANYTVATGTGVTTASIARAALTLNSISAGDKVYDGTLAASVSGTVSGVIGQDAVSLTGASGVFADRNAGTGKTVQVSGFQLTGSDAGNYSLTSTGGLTQASIAQRALATWTGASGGLWSDPANWEGGVAPSGNNVLAADMAAATGNVLYTAAAGDTVLNSFTSRGGLSLSGGSLAVNGAFGAASYAQSGGSLLVSGPFNVTSYGQSGGRLQVNGAFSAANHAQRGGSLQVSGPFNVASYVQSGGSLLVNGAFSAADHAQRGGSLQVGGPFNVASYAQSDGSLQVGGPFTVASYAQSDGSLQVGGAFNVTSYAQSDGSLQVSGAFNAASYGQSGGSLVVDGLFSAASYVQNGGLLGGAGNVAIGSSFSQTGGAINIGGNLTISQAAGDLRFAALTADTISLTASTGAIGQSGAVVARSLVTQSQDGTLLDDAGNRLQHFSASNSGSGGIALRATSAPDVLVLGSLATGAGDVRIESTGGIDSHAIATRGGNVTLVAHSPVNVLGAIDANDVTIDASTDVRFGDGARVNAARTVAVTAGAGVTFAGAATVDTQAAGSIAVLAQNGDLTADDTVRINSRGAPLSLLAPNGKVLVPAPVIVAAPVTPPVTTPVSPPVTPPVSPPATVPVVPAALAGSAVTALTSTYHPLNQLSTPNDVSSPLLAGTTSDASTKAPDDATHGIKKNYCN
ncbi:hypothetical protein ASF61_09235 [Duganella sp. Leaf126]|uniref:YDG domain-containing protein n=1 Tax=Duganella sp. Leaf126 TaxID=1736266 RepID=UPI0007140DE8|nr:YDG domain-containing protein [Duganella sp. Leaf126]KQQ33271.1 hypothetical protein ASF61_09235 [Duganella sp. Leaf126]